MYELLYELPRPVPILPINCLPVVVAIAQAGSTKWGPIGSMTVVTPMSLQFMSKLAGAMTTNVVA
jgi:hypothetical protein